VTSFRAVCTTQAAASLGSGALLLALPWPVLSLFALPLDHGTQLVARMLGGVLFALGATLLGVRDVREPDARKRVMIGNAACDGSLAILLAGAAAGGKLPMLGWGLAALFAINAGSWLLALRSKA
jgi:hypothetical protein